MYPPLDAEQERQLRREAARSPFAPGTWEWVHRGDTGAHPVVRSAPVAAPTRSSAGPTPPVRAPRRPSPSEDHRS